MKKTIIAIVFLMFGLASFGQYTEDKLPSGLTVATTANDADYTIIQKNAESIVKGDSHGFFTLVYDARNGRKYEVIDSVSGQTGQFIISDGVGWLAPVSAKYEGDGAFTFGQRLSGTIGSGSIVLGRGRATGARSFTINGITASGTDAIAMNGGIASGDRSIAMNHGVASGTESFAFSGGNASGEFSTAFSSGEASANYSTAWNSGTALGVQSTAYNGGESLGQQSAAWNNGISSGDYSTAWNYGDAQSYLRNIIWSIRRHSNDKNNLFMGYNR